MAGMMGGKKGASSDELWPGSPEDLRDAHTDEAFAGGDREQRSQSVADIFGSAGLTLYEKKCVLVNREIDNMGMGRYQWCLWGLCGR